MEGIKAGDVVQLKSGGSVMTVKDIDADAKVRCVWFDKEEKIKEYVFDTTMLEVYEAPEIFF